MSISSQSTSPSVGRFTGVVLGLTVFICVTMIAGTGYLKYQLDRAQTMLAAPDSAIGSDQDMFDRLRRDWGYGGFLGMAQHYSISHDTSGLAEMKAHIKSADDIVSRLPDRTPAETRHEMNAIAAAYDAALQKMIAVSASNTPGDFTNGDFAPLYAALPILDARVDQANAQTRLAAQNKMQFWAMLLTLVSWCSLIIAAACAAGIYLTLRDKHSAPMRALAQSIENMARGDMRTAIWGTERQDMIGELARAVDIARYHFSHLPDLSLLSEQGPLRMRFEGGSRSLFEAMMRAISRDSENIREQSAALTETTKEQKESIAVMSDKVETILQTILQRGRNGDQQIRTAISEMVGSAEGLRNAHAHAADQLNRLIPHIQERAQGLAEIAHIAGKQIGSSLQSLAASDMGLRTNSEQIKGTLSKLSNTADDLGARLFGAINLLQASGKVLAETTQDLKTRFGENALGGPSPAIDMGPMASKLEQIASQLSVMQMKIDAPQPGLASGLAGLNEKITALAASLPASITRDLKEDLQRLSAQASDDRLSALRPGPTSLPVELQKQLQDQWFQLSAQIEASRASLVEAVSAQIEKMGSKMGGGSSAASPSRAAADYAAQRQMEQQTQILTELVSTLGTLDAHMRQIQSEIHGNAAVR